MIFSAKFLINSVPLGWADVLWGYKNRLIGWRTPVDIVKRKKGDFSQDPLEVQLANIGKDEDWRISEILKDLAARDPTPESRSKRKWLYLTLLWLYENQQHVNDLFGQLEKVYADYDYPDEISSFVPFMPPDDGYDPRAHSPVENYNRILRKWRDYLDVTKSSLF